MALTHHDDSAMPAWLAPALVYLPQWLQFQLRQHDEPGAAVAVVHRGRVVLDEVYGAADRARDEPLTTRHRWRAASHSKTVAAVAIMKLREQGRLQLDDAVGRHIGGLHAAVARATIAQLLSHTAGTARDGPDAGFYEDRRPFLGADELRALLAQPPTIDANTRFKYSNLGYGLLGLVVEALTGEPYTAWVQREVIAAAGLADTTADAPPPGGAPLARGHGSRLLGRRAVMPSETPVQAMAPTIGLVTTASDLARFYAQLAPEAPLSVLSVDSRREMIRRQWRDPHSPIERYYGLGIASGALAGWDWFGHYGNFPGIASRTVVLPALELSLAIFGNAIDARSHSWVDGAVHLLAAFARRGPPAPTLPHGWQGRWWNHWHVIDLVPMGERFLVANPLQLQPFADVAELEVDGDSGRIALGWGYANHGEPARLVRDDSGRVTEVWLGGWRYLPEAQAAAEIVARYGAGEG